MKLGRHPLVMLLVVIAVLVTVTEGSRLVRASLLKPETWGDCFTSRAEDRPFAYPLVAQFIKFKDMAVRGFKKIMAIAKEKLE